MVTSTLEELKHEEAIESPTEEEITGFIDFYTSDEFHEQPLTTAKDIQEANRIINLALQQ